MDPFEEFEFKPLTDGLGFHKKAEKLKQDMRMSNLTEEKVGRSIPEAPPAEMLKPQSTSRSRNLLVNQDDDLDLGPAARSASQSISDLIAALPPSLDFLEGESAKTESESEADSASSYPFLQKRKRSSETKSVTSQGLPMPGAAAKTDISTAARLFDEPITETSARAKTEKKSDKATSLDESTRPQIFQPLGREEYTSPTEKAPLKTTSTPAATPPIPGTPANISAAAATSTTWPASNLPPAPTFKSTPGKPAVPASQNPKLEESYARAFPHAEKSKPVEKGLEKALEKTEATDLQAAPSELRKTSAAFAPAILDAMAILGVSTIFLVIIILITQVDIVRLLTHAKTNVATHVQLAFLFLSVMQLYMLSARSFFGATLGEWAFDMQVGLDEERKQAMYPARIIWRLILVLATGIVVLPLLSKITGRDLFAALGAPQLYRRS